MKNFTCTTWGIALLLFAHAALGQPATPGNALLFDGTSGFVSTTTSFTDPQAFTISVWFNTTTTQGGRLVGFANSQTGLSSTYDRHLYLDNNGHVNFGIYDFNFRVIGSTTACNDGNWHQAVGTFSPATGMSLYVDGVLASSNSTFTNDQTYTGWWKIGWDNLNGWPNEPASYFFKGTMDEVQVWNTVLTSSQIQNNLHHIFIGTESGLVSYWHFNEGSGTTTADSTATGNTGILQGGVTWVASTVPVVPEMFTTLYSFTGGNDGAQPSAGLILSGNTLYGTAVYGGALGNGTVFAVNTDGTGFTNLHSFTNADGTNPYGSLILSGNTLYGTAALGGSPGNMARCLPSTPMARVLRTCIVSRPTLFQFKPIATEPGRLPV